MSDDEILARAVRAFISELTGYTPSIELCNVFALLVVGEAEDRGLPLILTVQS